MPSSTFYNIPEAKRLRIINRCYEEFTNNNYHKASVSKIVSDLNISKGSIYKYFKNKQDLYMYLVNEAASAKLGFLGQAVNNNEGDFFELLWQVVKAGVEFDLSHQQYSLFLGKISTDKDALADFPINKQLISKSALFIKDLVETAQQNRQLRNDISADLITYYINTLVVNFAERMSTSFKLSYSVLLDAINNEKQGLSKELILNELNDLLTIIKEGLK